jgi:hypothetical protein
MPSTTTIPPRLHAVEATRRTIPALDGSAESILAVTH